MGVKCRCQRTKRSTESPQMKQGISLVPNSAAMLPVVMIHSSKQALRVLALISALAGVLPSSPGWLRTRNRTRRHFPIPGGRGRFPGPRMACPTCVRVRVRAQRVPRGYSHLFTAGMWFSHPFS